MAGPLSVSHLIVFSKTKQGNTSLRIARAPRGPTLHFKVLNYSLCKDVRRFVRAPKSTEGSYYQSPPLLVLNGFTADRSAAPEEVLLTTMFQNMFPPLSAQATKLSTIKRVMILNKDAKTGEIDLRHYAIETKNVDQSRAVKRLKTVKSKIHKALPNLGEKEDIADYLLDPAAGGYTSESEVEDDAMVEVDTPDAQNLKRNQSETADLEAKINSLTQKRAIKLVEIGPRIKLGLRKIEEGVCEGKILYHSYVHKSQTEIKALEKKHAQKAKLREERRKRQEENVRKKTEGKTSRMKRGKEKSQTEDKPEDDESADEGDVEEVDDDFEHDDDNQVFENEEEPFAGSDSDSDSE